MAFLGLLIIQMRTTASAGLNVRFEIPSVVPLYSCIPGSAAVSIKNLGPAPAGVLLPPA
jgi:hypothetical protein